MVQVSRAGLTTRDIVYMETLIQKERNGNSEHSVVSLAQLAWARLFKLPDNLKNLPPAPDFVVCDQCRFRDFPNFIHVAGKENHNLSVQNHSPLPFGDHLMYHLLDFLDRRKLSLKNDRFLHHQIPTNALTALDMIHYECPTSTPDKPGWVRFAFLPNQWFDEALPMAGSSWKRSFHPSSVQNLYSVLLRGGLGRSTVGSLYVGCREGIYSQDDFNTSCFYSPFSQIGIPGVWFQVVFEIARRWFPEENNGEQRLNVPCNVVLLGVWVKMKQSIELDVCDLLFLPPTEMCCWSFQFEANPFDPASPAVFRVREMDIDRFTLNFRSILMQNISDQHIIFDPRGLSAEDLAEKSRLSMFFSVEKKWYQSKSGLLVEQNCCEKEGSIFGVVTFFFDYLENLAYIKPRCCETCGCNPFRAWSVYNYRSCHSCRAVIKTQLRQRLGILLNRNLVQLCFDFLEPHKVFQAPLSNWHYIPR